MLDSSMGFEKARLLICKNYVTISLVLIVVLSFWIRIYNVEYNPIGFFTDEANFAYQAYMLLNYGTGSNGNSYPLIFTPFGTAQLPFYFYFSIPSVYIFGLNEFAARFTSVMAGTIAILLAFLVGKLLFKNNIAGLCTSICLAIMPWHIHYSKIAMDNVCSATLLLLFVYIFLLWNKNRRKLNLFLLSFVFVLNILNYMSGWVIIPILSISIIILYYKELFVINRYTLLCLSPFLIFLYMIISHDFFSYEQRYSKVWIGLDNTLDGNLILQIFKNYISHYSYSFLFENGDNNWNMRHYLQEYGMMYYVYIPIIVFGLIKLVFNLRKETVVLVILLLIYPIAGSLTPESPISNRNIAGSVVFAIIAGYGLYGIISIFYKINIKHKTKLTIILVCCFVLVFSFSTIKYSIDYHTKYPLISYGYYGWQAGAKEIVEHFQSVEHEYDQLIMSYKFNGPGMLLRFYNKGDNDKYIIGGIDKLNRDMKQLFALSIDDYINHQHIIKNNSDFNVLSTLYYPDNQPAFVFIESK